MYASLETRIPRTKPHCGRVTKEDVQGKVVAQLYGSKRKVEHADGKFHRLGMM